MSYGFETNQPQDRARVEEGPSDPAFLCERVEGEGVPRYRCVFGLRLTALCSSFGSDAANGHTGDCAETAVRLSGLLPEACSQTVELRYRTQVEPGAHVGRRLLIELLVGQEAETPEEVRRLTRAEWENLQPWLAVESSQIVWNSCRTEEEVRTVLHPFPIHDLVEVVRKETVRFDGQGRRVALPGPLRLSGTPLQRLCEALLACPAPVLVSIGLRPVILTPPERAALGMGFQGLQQVDSTIGFHPSNGSLPSHPTSGLTSISDRMFLMRVHLASSHDLPRSVIELVGTELMGRAVAPVDRAARVPGRWADQCAIQGHTWVRPETEAARAAALHNLRYHGERIWAPSLAPEILSRLRYLADSVEASAIFRLPSTEGHQMPGLRTVPALPRPSSEEGREGLCLGTTILYGRRVTVVTPREHQALHTFIVGATGSGKSTLLQRLALQDMDRGLGVILFDYHGDLCEEILGRIPPNRLEDVIYFNPADTEYPIGMNLLAYERTSPCREEEQEAIANFVHSYLQRNYLAEHMGPIFFQAVRNGLLLTLAGEEAGNSPTLLDFVELFTNNDTIVKRLPSVRNPLVRKYWETMVEPSSFGRPNNEGTTFRQWILSKFSLLVDLSLTRNILCQPTSLSFRQVLDTQTILLCNLSKGRLGSLAATFLGFLLLFKLEQAALSRAEQHPSDRRPVSLYIDEVQNLDTANFSGMVSELRKYRVSLTLACQHLSQLAPTMQDAVLANCGTWIAFRTGPRDAGLLAQILGVRYAEALVQLPNYQALVRRLRDGQPEVVGIETLPLNGGWDQARTAAIVARSRQNYTRPRTQVEAEIFRRWHTADPLPDCLDPDARGPTTGVSQ